MALALSVTLAQAACVGTASVPASREPVRVTNNGQPFQMWEGALARKAADAACGGKVRMAGAGTAGRTTGGKGWRGSRDQGRGIRDEGRERRRSPLAPHPSPIS